MHSSPQGHSALRAHSRHCFSARASLWRILAAAFLAAAALVVGGGARGSSSSSSSAAAAAVVSSFAPFSSALRVATAAGVVLRGVTQYSRLIGAITVLREREREGIRKGGGESKGVSELKRGDDYFFLRRKERERFEEVEEVFFDHRKKTLQSKNKITHTLQAARRLICS